MLSVQMQRAAASGVLRPYAEDNGIQQFSNKLTAIGVHVSHLSHKLHSSELEYLGLAVAITKLCREFSDEYAIRVSCACWNIPKELNGDIGLTFLRIVQEALHHAAKHSGAGLVQVEVTGAAEEINLIVCDDGRGFDVQRSKTAAGLG